MKLGHRLLLQGTLLAAGLTTACTSCPPSWVAHTPSAPGWIYGAGQCAEVFVDADRTALALSRAARVLADDLGLALEQRLSVRYLDGQLFIEAVGEDGPVDALAGLELVHLTTCEETVYALLRLPSDEGA